MLLLLLLTSAFVLLPWAGAGRIIGGREVKPHSRPYMAYLKIESDSESNSCGGFLIRPDAVLSAAHCVDKEGIRRVTVTLGAHDVSYREQSQQRFRVGHWVKHPNYSRVSLKNDIVLLKLKPKANITKYVKPISLPRSNERLGVGAECEVAGWGWTSVSGQRTNVMRQVELKVQDEAICEKTFCNYQPESMICVGEKYDVKASYLGDSGGPLVCAQKAHGIVSHGPNCHLFPEVYTRVSCFKRWIHEQLRRFALQELPGSPSSD